MLLVLSDALPDAAAAAPLADALPDAAPTLHRWLREGRAVPASAPPALTGCTPCEYWMLQDRGYQPPAALLPASGLGPLLAQQASPSSPLAGPVWLADLVHVAPSTDGAALLPGEALDIREDESVALIDAARDSLLDSGFSLLPLAPGRWRVDVPEGFSASRCASPALAARSSARDWWPQDAQARPWRRLANELQMCWYQHPVNQARQARGLHTLNTLWLYGGGPAEGLRAPGHPEARLLRELSPHAVRQDWARWLDELRRLELTVFAPLATRPAPSLVLTGGQRYVALEPRRGPGWLRWRPGGGPAWRRWWSPPD